MRSLFKKIRRIILCIIIVILAVASYYIHDGYDMYKEAIAKCSIQDKVLEIKSDEDYVTIDQVSNYFTEAIISVEDKRFYSHFGLDLYSIGRAFLSNVQNKKITGGGSTITQQLAKNMYFDQNKKLARKVAEVFVSLDLEENYEKDEILELYINIIYFGDGYYGIKEATNGYFDKEPKDLTLEEATLLAGIPNAPSVYQLSNNSKYTYQRQIIVVDSMLSNNCITQEQRDNLVKSIEDNM